MVLKLSWDTPALSPSSKTPDSTRSLEETLRPEVAQKRSDPRHVHQQQLLKQ